MFNKSIENFSFFGYLCWPFYNGNWIIMFSFSLSPSQNWTCKLITLFALFPFELVKALIHQNQYISMHQLYSTSWNTLNSHVIMLHEIQLPLLVMLWHLFVYIRFLNWFLWDYEARNATVCCCRRGESPSFYSCPFFCRWSEKVIYWPPRSVCHKI